MSLEDNIEAIKGVVKQNRKKLVLVVQRQKATFGRYGCMGGSETEHIIGGRDALFVVGKQCKYDEEKNKLLIPVDVYVEQLHNHSWGWNLEESMIELKGDEISDLNMWRSDKWRFGLQWDHEGRRMFEDGRNPHYTLRILTGEEISLFFKLEDYRALIHQDFISDLRAGNVPKERMPQGEESSSYLLARELLGLKVPPHKDWFSERQVKKERVLEYLLNCNYRGKIQDYEESIVKLRLREAIILGMHNNDHCSYRVNNHPANVPQFVRKMCLQYGVKLPQ